MVKKFYINNLLWFYLVKTLKRLAVFGILVGVGLLLNWV